MARAYLSLGSNIEPERNLREAVAALRERFGDVAVSPTYRSAAVGFDGAAFLNCAAAFDCELDRVTLHAWLHALEDASGRDRSLPRYADRTLDLDIALWCEDGACNSDLTRAEFERAHVLAPLADLAPALREPFSGATLQARWQQLAPTLPKLDRLQPGMP
ncbi:MAG TPA: 2-amino-4-hydroxy-6-hydroxymethyldihydropteridine diphosphokinase [Rhodanobacteraceae bacterium]|jgi:2-amino-4-hydroxy-6-hydroxymethyldihydropteridine diphosphokinase|nr:2-amino-4-hydroxy-6-hydroxymethyldihydropteridine diphosphokinase [Rhodanobacteraceae bacterium]